VGTGGKKKARDRLGEGKLNGGPLHHRDKGGKKKNKKHSDADAQIKKRTGKKGENSLCDIILGKGVTHPPGDKKKQTKRKTVFR